MMKMETRLAAGRNDSRKGFTLVDLLVVIAIIAVLATIILPGLGKIRTKAKNLKCQNNLKGLYAGILMYEGDYKVWPQGNMNHGRGFWEVLRTLPDPDHSEFKNKKNDLYVCPIKGSDPNAMGCDYMGPAYDVSDAVDEMTPLGADLDNNHDPAARNQGPINVLYWGGTIANLNYTSDSAEWANVHNGENGASAPLQP